MFSEWHCLNQKRFNTFLKHYNSTLGHKPRLLMATGHISQGVKAYTDHKLQITAMVSDWSYGQLRTIS